MFWEIVNHKDAVQIKFEISKGLAQFTYENTREQVKAKKKLSEKIAMVDKDTELSKEEKK